MCAVMVDMPKSLDGDTRVSSDTLIVVGDDGSDVWEMASSKGDLQRCALQELGAQGQG